MSFPLSLNKELILYNQKGNSVPFFLVILLLLSHLFFGCYEGINGRRNKNEMIVRECEEENVEILKIGRNKN